MEDPIIYNTLTPIRISSGSSPSLTFVCLIVCLGVLLQYVAISYWQLVLYYLFLFTIPKVTHKILMYIWYVKTVSLVSFKFLSCYKVLEVSGGHCSGEFGFPIRTASVSYRLHVSSDLTFPLPYRKASSEEERVTIDVIHLLRIGRIFLFYLSTFRGKNMRENLSSIYRCAFRLWTRPMTW